MDSLTGCEPFKKIDLKPLLLIEDALKAYNKLISDNIAGKNTEIPDYKL